MPRRFSNCQCTPSPFKWLVGGSNIPEFYQTLDQSIGLSDFEYRATTQSLEVASVDTQQSIGISDFEYRSILVEFGGGALEQDTEQQIALNDFEYRSIVQEVGSSAFEETTQDLALSDFEYLEVVKTVDGFEHQAEQQIALLDFTYETP